MHFVLLHYAAPPIIGGVEAVIARQAKYLLKAGHQVTILAGRGGTWDDRIPVHVLPLLDSRHPQILEAKGELDQGHVPPNMDALVATLERLLEPYLLQADVLIAHNVATQHKNLPLTVALYHLTHRGIPRRVILWHHDLAWTAERYQKELHPGWPWDLLRQAWPNTIQVVVSEARCLEWSQLSGLPCEKIHVIPAGIEQAEFLGLSEVTRDLFERLNLATAMPILLCPVRITRRKNLEQALQIMAELHALLPEAKLIITGPPGAHNPDNLNYYQTLLSLRAQLKIENSVHLLAEFHPEGVSDIVIADLYRLADALLLTSREEGFGIPLLEAGLSRLPIFCTGIPPLRAIAQEDAYYFTPETPPTAIAHAIKERLEGDPLYRVRSRVRLNFSWEVVYQRQIAPLLEGL
ncbi:glycosyltransferase [uncultured Thermanaerothrix sp.]|uniref:glycosyltransferase n=1 Tax=uncultured Thermanaerothrix sp. TaxID=1195149 RepID=UPI002632FAB0|nr:glycosyltransferase [uncultured Thermanaerothrix sp.]